MDLNKILKDLASAERELLRGYERGERVGHAIKDLRSAIKGLNARKREQDRPARSMPATEPAAPDAPAD